MPAPGTSTVDQSGDRVTSAWAALGQSQVTPTREKSRGQIKPARKLTCFVSFFLAFGPAFARENQLPKWSLPRNWPASFPFFWDLVRLLLKILFYYFIIYFSFGGGRVMILFDTWILVQIEFLIYFFMQKIWNNNFTKWQNPKPYCQIPKCLNLLSFYWNFRQSGPPSTYKLTFSLIPNIHKTSVINFQNWSPTNTHRVYLQQTPSSTMLYCPLPKSRVQNFKFSCTKQFSLLLSSFQITTPCANLCVLSTLCTPLYILTPLSSLLASICFFPFLGTSIPHHLSHHPQNGYNSFSALLSPTNALPFTTTRWCTISPPISPIHPTFPLASCLPTLSSSQELKEDLHSPHSPKKNR